jgi:xylan 1,4-beta-xylosidase
MNRRHLLTGAAALPVSAVLGGGTVAADTPEPVMTIASSVFLANDAGTGRPQFRRNDFGIVGVFDVDWLIEPRFTRLLDIMAASPGAFSGVRFFGALNSGERENVFPKSSGRVWPDPASPMDFSVTLSALEALVTRGLVPFVNLSFFPAAVSSTPIRPPDSLGNWQTLIRAFLDAVVARFGADAVAGWWFEGWNEPNMRPFWGGSFDRYLDLYRATSEAVLQSGHRVRLGGPALAYMPSDGRALMGRFLNFLHDEPGVKCDFISFHRKGIWVAEESVPELSRPINAAEEVAAAIIRTVPDRAQGMVVINNEADMKVAFDTPYEPRMTEQFPAWLAALMVAYDGLNARFASQGMRFIAAADNANQQLIREPFDGRRSVATIGSGSETDLVKLPVYAFYEILKLLGDRHGQDTAGSPSPDLFHLVTAAPTHIAALLTRYNATGGAGARRIELALRDIPWERVNIARFQIDAMHSNSYTAAGRRMAALPSNEGARQAMRMAQELAPVTPIRRGVTFSGGEFRVTIDLANFTTALIWMTPFVSDAPAAPRWIDQRVDEGRVVLRWTPNLEPFFYAYELLRETDGAPGVLISPASLRAATWTDAAPPRGSHVYAVRAVTASGIASELVRSAPIRLG